MAGQPAGTSALYVGAIITALTLPDVLASANVIDGGEGWGTLFLGIAFLIIAAIRAVQRGGWGWQLVFGGLLVLTGSSTVARHVAGFPAIGQYAWPLALIALGDRARVPRRVALALVLTIVASTARRSFPDR